jgi:hypothetical protein
MQPLSPRRRSLCGLSLRHGLLTVTTPSRAVFPQRDSPGPRFRDFEWFAPLIFELALQLDCTALGWRSPVENDRATKGRFWRKIRPVTCDGGS